jgi:hypothetical protein
MDTTTMECTNLCPENSFRTPNKEKLECMLKIGTNYVKNSCKQLGALLRGD